MRSTFVIGLLAVLVTFPLASADGDEAATCALEVQTCIMESWPVCVIIQPNETPPVEVTTDCG